MFTDERLYPWRHSLPPAGNVDETIAALISLLVDREHADSGRSALVLFLEVYSEQFDAGDSCRPRISALARELEQHNPAGSPAQVKSGRPAPPETPAIFSTFVAEGGTVGQQVNIHTHEGDLHLGDVNLGGGETGSETDRDKDQP